MAESTSKSPWIIEPTEETFQKDVVERSREVPIVIDFWAEWCQPCRMLAPILEKLAVEYDGRFVLAKANTEKLPSIAAGFGVQSIPAVYGVRDGQILDFFVGVLPEPQIRAWLDRLLPSRAETLTAEAKKLTATDPAKAEALLREAHTAEPNLAKSQIALAELLFSQGRADESRQILTELEERGFLEPEAEKLKAQLDFNAHRGQSGDLAKLEAAAAADPNSLDLRLKLAEALAAEGRYQEALELALSLVQADRKKYGEQARKIMVDIFHLLPDDSELASEYRRKLSTALY